MFARVWVVIDVYFYTLKDTYSTAVPYTPSSTVDDSLSPAYHSVLLDSLLLLCRGKNIT